MLAAEALRRRNLAGLPCLAQPPGGRPADLEGIDVIVPARNEATGISRCVTALRRCTAVARVIVVDDGSADATAEVARAAGAEVIPAGEPPAGWMGKPHACATGAGAATAPWLAFVDADVVLHPQALVALIEHCHRSGAAAASPLLSQRCTGPGDKLLVPLAWWQYLVGLPGAGRLLNGQCILISADVYGETGGHAHARVRGSVVEDAALGRVLAAQAGGPALVRAAWAGEVRMYHGLLEVRSGFGKNMAGFLSGGPARGALVAFAGVALSAPLPLLLRGRRGAPLAQGTGLLPWVLAACLLAPRYAEAGVPRAVAAGAPAGAVILQLIALESLLRAALRRPHLWRGRPARATR